MYSNRSVWCLTICLAALLCSAAQAENGVLKFMMVGDWGGQTKKPYYTDAEEKIADQMGKTADDIGANFTVAVGDNFYDDGVKDVDDKRFKETFEVSKTLFLYRSCLISTRRTCLQLNPYNQDGMW